MNEIQRSVLQRHIKQLADDIMLTEELLATMFQRKIFERNMIEAIKAEKTHTDQLYKMLNMLPRRGPDAFETFIDIIKNDYPWLAATLETNYKTESDTLQRQNSQMTLFTCGSATTSRCELLQDGQPRTLPTEVHADPDIKTRVGTFIHKHFGQSKRISQLDKKTMEKWLSEQIQAERKIRVAKSSVCEEPDERDSSTSPLQDMVHEDLKRVFEKVRDENLSDLLNSDHSKQHIEDNCDGSVQKASDEVDSLAEGTGPKSYESMEQMVANLEAEVDKLINRMNHLEGMITQCHYILGDPDRKFKLPNLVKETQYTSKQIEKELGKEKVKSEKMLHEIYDYSKSIHKLENDKLHQRQEFEKLRSEIEDVKRENAVLSEKCKTLEDANLKHLEKEKTLQNLRKMVDDLKTSHSSLVDENSNYRINYGTGNFKSLRRPPRIQTRRGSTVDIPSGNSVRKPVQKAGISTTRKKPSIMSRTS